jgi:hypothetical protein
MSSLTYITLQEICLFLFFKHEGCNLSISPYTCHYNMRGDVSFPFFFGTLNQRRKLHKRTDVELVHDVVNENDDSQRSSTI